jgi:hypothetical protein
MRQTFPFLTVARLRTLMKKQIPHSQYLGSLRPEKNTSSRPLKLIDIDVSFQCVKGVSITHIDHTVTMQTVGCSALHNVT